MESMCRKAEWVSHAENKQDHTMTSYYQEVTNTMEIEKNLPIGFMDSGLDSTECFEGSTSCYAL